MNDTKMTMLDYFRKFQNQMKTSSFNNQNIQQTNETNQETTNQVDIEDYSGFSIGQGYDNQGKGLINDVLKNTRNNQNINVTSNRPTSHLELSNVCSECGTIHPPLEPGQKCPIAQSKQQIQKSGLSEEKVNKFVQDLRNIIIANLSEIKVESAEKVLQEVVVEVTKFLEKYQQK